MKWSDLVKREAWNDMIRLKRIPESGWILAYLRKMIVFEPYNSLGEIGNLFGDGELLELHLFDTENEYRAVKTRGSLSIQGGDYIECTVPGVEDTDSEYYEEEVLLDQGKGTIFVRNYLKYSEEGMAYVYNYRLIMGR